MILNVLVSLSLCFSCYWDNEFDFVILQQMLKESNYEINSCTQSKNLLLLKGVKRCFRSSFLWRSTVLKSGIPKNYNLAMNWRLICLLWANLFNCLNKKFILVVVLGANITNIFHELEVDLSTIKIPYFYCCHWCQYQSFIFFSL